MLRKVSLITIVSSMILVFTGCSSGNSSKKIKPGDQIMINIDHSIPVDGKYKAQHERGAYFVGIVEDVLGDQVKYQATHFVCKIYLGTADEGTSFQAGKILCASHACGRYHYKINGDSAFVETTKVMPITKEAKEAKIKTACNS